MFYLMISDPFICIYIICMSLYVRYYPLISNDAPIFLGHLGTIPIISLYLLDHCCCSRHTIDVMLDARQQRRSGSSSDVAPAGGVGCGHVGWRNSPNHNMNDERIMFEEIRRLDYVHTLTLILTYIFITIHYICAV